MSITILSSVLLTGASLPAADTAAITAAVKAIYAPYARAENRTTSWDRPMFSAELTSLIARWRRGAPANEPDALSDGDWFCLCQDADWRAFRAEAGAPRALTPTTAEVSVRLTLGWGETRDARLILKREANGWRLDDLFAAEDFPRGLKEKLVGTIAENIIQRIDKL